MPLSGIFKGSFSAKRATAPAGTVITVLIPPAMRGARTRITNIVYTQAGTVHTLTGLRTLARTTITEAAAAAAVAVKVLSAAFLNQVIAANDYIVIRHTDGTFGDYLVSAVGGTGNLTLTVPALSAAVSVGDLVWILGATGEAEHFSTQVPASLTSRLQDDAGIITSGYRSVYAGTVYNRSGNDDPILMHSNNATAAGSFDVVSGYYGAP